MLIAVPQHEMPETAADQRARLLAPSRFLGRQPIVDAGCRLFGYELLLRPEKMARVNDDPEQLTREVVDHWLLLIPDETQGCAFVSCTRTAVVDRVVSLLPAGNTILGIPASLEADPALVESCNDLRQIGYRFALDRAAELEADSPFLDIAEFIRIDFPHTDHAKRREIYRMAKRSGIRFVAGGIETEIQMRIALAEGSSLFQGNFVCQPVLFSSRSVPQNTAVYLSLLGLLQKIPSDLRKVEKLISGDPSLCFRVLRLANSALTGHPGVVTSLREALLLIGDEAMRRLVTVAMAGALAAHRSPALLSMALTRARFCELLAPSLSEQPAQFYLLGILSLLDVLLENSLSRILQSLPISAEMKAALGGDGSSGGRALGLVRNLEGCEWERCEELQGSLGLAEGVVAGHYVEAVRWAETMMGKDLLACGQG